MGQGLSRVVLSGVGHGGEEDEEEEEDVGDGDLDTVKLRYLNFSF